jgi:hypothetical protein
LVVVILLAICGYYIIGYLWLLVVIILMVIGDYYINAYLWLFYW